MARAAGESATGRVLPVVLAIVAILVVVGGAAAYLQARYRYENPGLSSDSVLAGQIFGYKDSIWPQLDTVRFTGPQTVRDAVADGKIVGGTHWDGATDPAALGLGEGGVVSYDYQESPYRVTVVIASGPRRGDADAPVPLFSDYAWYTCAVLTFAVYDEPPEYDWERLHAPVSLVDTDCDADLVATLDSRYVLRPISEFSG